VAGPSLRAREMSAARLWPMRAASTDVEAGVWSVLPRYRRDGVAGVLEDHNQHDMTARAH
jgi:hypothetical protein